MMIIKQILTAINYCHKQGIIHRDIKAENILFTANDVNSQIKIIDFGISVKYQKDTKIKDKAGTILYIAPEVLNGSYDEKCDVWSTGVLMYLILCGEPPFYDSTRKGIVKLIRKGKVSFSQDVWSRVSAGCQQLIKMMLTLDPESRASCDEVLKHPWFSHDPKLSTLITKQYLDSMTKFAAGTTFSHALLTFIVTNIAHKDAHDDALKLFKSLDRDGDGKLTHEELVAGFIEVYPLKSRAEIETEVTNIITQIDSNQSGAIDFTEYLVAAMKQQINLSKSIINSAFRAFDTDGNGQISKEEFMKIMKNVSISDEEWSTFLKECDSDNDGQVK